MKTGKNIRGQIRTRDVPEVERPVCVRPRDRYQNVVRHRNSLTILAVNARTRRGARPNATDIHRRLYYSCVMKRQSLLSRLLHAAAAGAFRIGSRVTVHGRENIPATGPVIVVVNHTHNMDPALIGVIMPWQVRFLAKRDLVTGGNPLTRWLVRTWGLIPLARDTIDREGLAAAQNLLSAGGAIGMFPEGSRSRDGQLRRARPGAGFLAVTTGATVLPVAIEGFVGLGHNPLFMTRRPRVTARIGKPIHFPDVDRAQERDGTRAGERSERAVHEMMHAIAGLLPEHMRGYYGDNARTTPHEDMRVEQ